MNRPAINTHILKQVNTHFKGRLNKEQLSNIFEGIQKINIARLVNKHNNIQLVISSIIRTVIRQINKQLTRDTERNEKKHQELLLASKKSLSSDPNDIKQYMYDIINIPDNKVNHSVQQLYETIDLEITSIFNISSIKELKKQINPVSMYKKAYIILDTKNRRLDVPISTGKFSWWCSQNRFIEQGVVNTTHPMKNVVAIQLYQPVIPSSSSLTNSTTQRVSILIEELRASAHIASASRSYHWLCRFVNSLSAYTPVRHVDLQIEDFNDGLFKFPKPVNLFNSITLSFGDPLSLLAFNNDRQSAIVSAYGATTTITTPSAHNLVSGDLVYITGFTTNTASYNNDLVNDVFGQTATVTGATTFTIPVNTSSVSVSWIANQPVDLFYAAFRAIIPMEITYVDDDWRI